MAYNPLIGASMLAGSGGTSQSGSQSTNTATALSQARTWGREATAQAINSANQANAYAAQMWQKTADYNADQAAIQRAWQEKMANTVYQRTVKDMVAAGINPILAANMGLGTASVSSGSTASMGNPMAFMANTIPESQSASQSESYGQSSGWSESLSGLAYLADAISGAIEKITGSQKIDIAINGLADIFNSGKDKDVDQSYSKAAELISDITGTPMSEVKDKLVTKDSNKYNYMINNLKKNNPALYKSPGRINEPSWIK